MKKLILSIAIIAIGLFYAEKQGLLPVEFRALIPQFGSYREVKISQILNDTTAFHKENVSVTGYVTDYQERVSKRGNNYTVFQLYNNSESITVHYQGHLGLSENLIVTVKGEFLKEKRLRNLRFYNQIEADSATTLN